ncbi:MAG: type II secretion system major pseudopilin GspG [Limisphaerales bacterium]
MNTRTLTPRFKGTKSPVSSVERRWDGAPPLAPRPSPFVFRISDFGLPTSPPRRRAAPDTGTERRLAAFTLIEIMVVVVILGILAATLIPQFIGTTHDAKVSAAKAHVAELESALERFYIHMDRYPTMDEGLKVLVEPPMGDDKKWRGPYIRELRHDPWGNPYQYRIPGVRHPASFDLWSRGADGVDGGEGQGADIGNWGE